MASLLQKFFTRFARWANHHPYRVLIGVLGLTVLAGVGASRLRFETDILSLLPEDDPAVSLLIHIGEALDSENTLLALISVPEHALEEPGEALVSFARIFKDQLQATAPIDAVEYGLSSEQLKTVMTFFLEHGLLLLSDKERDEVYRGLEPEAIKASVAQSKRMLMSEAGTAAGDLIAYDPAGVFTVLVNHFLALSNSQNHIETQDDEGVFLAEDQRHLLVLIKPSGRPQDMDFVKTLMKEIVQIEQRTRELFRRWYETSDYEGESIPEVMIEYTGSYPMALADEKTIKRDILVTLITSLPTVLFFFFLFFRRFSSVLLMSLPLVIGVVWTLGVGGMVLGRITAATGAFAAILIGLGIDFGIHLYARYLEERHKGNSVEDSLALSCGEAGVGVFTGALTTSVAFLIITWTDFKGLQDLAFMSGIGILCTFAAMFTLIPALITILHQKDEERSDRIRGLTSGGFERLVGILLARPKVVVITAAGLTLLALAFSMPKGRLQIGFDSELGNLRPEDDASLKIQKKIEQLFGGNQLSLMIGSETATHDDGLSIHHTLIPVFERLQEQGFITSYQTPLVVFARQDEQLRVLADLRQHLEPATIAATIREALVGEGFEVDRFTDYLATVAEFLTVQEPVSPQDYEEATIQKVAGLFAHRIPEGVRLISYLYLPEALWAQREVQEAIMQAFAPNSSVVLSGMPVVIAHFKEIVRSDMSRSVVLAGGAIFILLFIHFRRLSEVVLAMMPLLFSLIWLVAIMTISGSSFNFMNIIVMPLLLGIGIDDGVHAVTRYKLNHAPLTKNLGSISVAIFLTSVTTICGFGSLMTAHYPGLRSIGSLAALGVGLCFISTVVVLPPMIAAFLGPKNPSA